MSEETIKLTRLQANNTETVESKYPSEVIDLPSKGYFYNEASPLSLGKTDLRFMSAREEDILSNENLIRRGDVLTKLLEALIVNKKINVDDLLIGDKNALFIAARRLAYGDNYGPVKVACKSCREESEIEIDLSQFKAKEFNFDGLEKGKNSFLFTLPYSNKVIEYKIPTGKDEAIIEGELKALHKINKNASGEVTTRLRNIILSVDGNSDKGFIRKFVDNDLLSRDSIALRNDIKDKSPDLDLTFDFTCEHCNNTERMGVPMTAQFFWPSS